MYGHTNPTVRTIDGEQVGPKMHSAVEAVARHAYPSKNQLAKAVGPHGSQDYGYRIVDRCISKNLLALAPDHEEATPNGRGAVILTAKGARYLNDTTDADLDADNYAPADARYSQYHGGWVDGDGNELGSVAHE